MKSCWLRFRLHTYGLWKNSKRWCEVCGKMQRGTTYAFECPPRPATSEDIRRLERELVALREHLGCKSRDRAV